MSDLKPCPFCGMEMDSNDPEVMHPATVGWADHPADGTRYYVPAINVPKKQRCITIKCPSIACGAEITADTRDEAVEQWNSRVGHE